MKNRNLIMVALLAVVFTACINQQNKDQSVKEASIEATADYTLIGKKGVLTFPEMKAEVNYISDSALHWKTTDSKGVVAEGDEKINYKKLTDNLYFLNWIEQDGWTVSQIIDTKNGTVKAFWSFNDDKSKRGKRASTFVDAKFEIVK
jgi:hypothetical protein